MANVSRVRGFIPVRYLNGAPYNGQAQEYLILGADEATAVFIGDLVAWGGNGGAAGSVVSGRDVEGMPSVIHASGTTSRDGLVGVVVGFIQDQTIPLKYNPASTNRIVLVSPLTNLVYEVQEDGIGQNIVRGDMGNNYGYNSGAGSTVTGASAYSLDSSASATTSTFPWRMLGLVKRPDNALGLSSTDLAKFEVTFNSEVQVGV